MEPKVCKDCMHFRRHYIKRSRGNYRALSYGHCSKPRLKKRDAGDEACSCWEEKPAERNASLERLDLE